MTRGHSGTLALAHTLTPASPNSSNPNVVLTLNLGVAAVSLDYDTTTVGGHVMFVNLNPLFDDDRASFTR